MINLFTYLQNIAREVFDKAYNFAWRLIHMAVPIPFYFPQYSIVFLIFLLSFFKNSNMNPFLFLLIYILLMQPPPREI